MAEILQHGQELHLRTRRGVDFGLKLTLLTAPLPGGTPIDITGAVVASRIFATGQPDTLFDATVDGVNGVITILVPAGRTLNMVQDWQYVVAYKLAGKTTPLIYGNFKVAQEQV